MKYKYSKLPQKLDFDTWGTLISMNTDTIVFICIHCLFPEHAEIFYAFFDCFIWHAFCLYSKFNFKVRIMCYRLFLKNKNIKLWKLSFMASELNKQCDTRRWNIIYYEQHDFDTADLPSLSLAAYPVHGHSRSDARHVRHSQAARPSLSVFTTTTEDVFF